MKATLPNGLAGPNASREAQAVVAGRRLGEAGKRPEPQSKRPESTITPPIEVPWPPIHLVAEATTMSAPCSIGRHR